MSETPKPITLLAPDYTGMRCSGLRYLREIGRGYSFMRRQMADHLEELAERYYSGDITAVDEFLQLYSIGRDQRKAVKEAPNANN